MEFDLPRFHGAAIMGYQHVLRLNCCPPFNVLIAPFKVEIQTLQSHYQASKLHLRPIIAAQVDVVKHNNDQFRAKNNQP